MKVITDLINITFKLMFIVLALATWGAIDIVGDIDDLFDA